MMSSVETRTMTALFVSCWMVLTLHFATNIAREHYPAMSLAERGTLAVDEYVDLHPDIFVAPNGHAYINNNPGVSILAAVPLFMVRPALAAAESYGRRKVAESGGRVSADYADHRPNRLRFYRQVRERGLDIKFGIVSFTTVALLMAPLTALAGLVFYHALRRLHLSRAGAILHAFVLVLGTPLFFRSGYLNHNHVLGLAVFFAFVLLWRPGIGGVPPRSHLAYAGLLGGLAVLCDYSGTIPLAFLFLFAAVRLWQAGSGNSRGSLAGGLATFAAAAAIPLAVLLAYQWSAFGSPWRPAQAVMPETTFSGYGYRGMSWPAPDLIAANLFDLRFGLFAFCPLLVLGLPGLWMAPPEYLSRHEKQLLAAAGVAFLLFCSANQFARMQWNTGVRYLVPMIPFLIIGVVVVLERLPARLRYLVAGLAFAQSWAIAMVRESVPESLTRVLTNGPELPWLTVVGKMAPQYLPGMDGPPPAWPLLVLALAAVGAVWARARRGTRASHALVEHTR
jgi:hypothetical protein